MRGVTDAPAAPPGNPRGQLDPETGLPIGRDPRVVRRIVRDVARRVVIPLRRRLPGFLVPGVVRLRTMLAMRSSFKVASSRKQMEILLDALPGYDLDEMTRRHVWFTQRRAEYRFHPDLVSDQELVGLENVEQACAGGRGVLLSFMHYGHYDGCWLTLKKAGLETDAMVIQFLYDGIGTDWQRQHARLLRMGTRMHSVEGGSQVVRDLLAEGRVVALASDVTSRTKVPFMGKDRRASFGAPRIAHEMGVPVVVMTFSWTGRKPRITLHEPLQPVDFPDARALYDRMLEIHEAAVREWPWSYELPQDRWVVWADEAETDS
jgi:lauroyl/myristoyl acyltransferase